MVFITGCFSMSALMTAEIIKRNAQHILRSLTQPRRWDRQSDILVSVRSSWWDAIGTTQHRASEDRWAMRSARRCQCRLPAALLGETDRFCSTLPWRGIVFDLSMVAETEPSRS